MTGVEIILAGVFALVVLWVIYIMAHIHERDCVKPWARTIFCNYTIDGKRYKGRDPTTWVLSNGIVGQNCSIEKRAIPKVGQKVVVYQSLLDPFKTSSVYIPGYRVRVYVIKKVNAHHMKGDDFLIYIHCPSKELTIRNPKKRLTDNDIRCPKCARQLVDTETGHKCRACKKEFY
jgi:hypothetical protein